MKVKEEQQKKPKQPSQKAVLTNQQFEECAQSALDAVCRSGTQTYEQFMSNFTHLTPDDLRQRPEVNFSGEDDWQPPSLPSLDSLGAAAPLPLQSIHAEASVPVNKVGVQDEKHAQEKIRHNPDALEEEVLEEGTITQPYLMRSDENTKSLRVKLGNFVEEEDSCDEEQDDGYSPSFTTSGSKEGENKGEEEPLHNSNEPHFENEEINKQSPKASHVVCEKNVSLKSSQNIDAQDSNPNKQGASDYKLPTKDCEAVARKIASASVKHENCDNKEENLLDLIGGEDSQSEESDLEYDANLDLPNPGEIVETKDTIVRDFVTKLNFTARVVDTRKKPDKEENHCAEIRGKAVSPAAQNSEEPCQCNDVQPFALEADFDYDNVVLSPKYNAEEMAIILNAMKATAEEQLQTAAPE